ncbi:FG-GAP repeat domain-containing protein [Seohaeicola saemankumensis]|uniref:FG-GAP repeat domain-containing protein n=1 Tax=Seohaeicola saemankumensis TaxID=481181 RepID=A0ABW3TGW8_9RHOB
MKDHDNIMRISLLIHTIFVGILAALIIAPAPAPAQPTEVSVAGPKPPAGASLPWPVAVSLSGPTDRYPHNVLGRIAAFTSLTVSAQVCEDCPQPRIGIRVTLDAPLVFEDATPRLWDVTGDGRPEIVVVQSHESKGARLTVWELGKTASGTPDLTLLASTDFIGTRFRWLAPFGVGDFTSDGKPEIAYVETPHLGKTMRLVGLEGDRLVPRGALQGVTNHRIGEEDIAGGVRDCAGRVEAILASGDWRRIVAVGWQEGELVSRDLGALQDRQDLTRALTCAN